MPWTFTDWIVWISLFVCFVLLIWIWFSRIQIYIYSRSHGNNDYGELKVNALNGLVKFSFKVPHFYMKWTGVQFNEQSKIKGTPLARQENEVELETSYMDLYHKIIDMLKTLSELKKWVLKLLKKIELHQWEWNSRIGTGDAMWTAMSCGAVWGVKSTIFGLTSGLIQVKNKPLVTVEPIYQSKFFATEWKCRLSCKFGPSLIAGAYLIVHYLIYKKIKWSWTHWLLRLKS